MPPSFVKSVSVSFRCCSILRSPCEFRAKSIEVLRTRCIGPSASLEEPGTPTLPPTCTCPPSVKFRVRGAENTPSLGLSLRVRARSRRRLSEELEREAGGCKLGEPDRGPRCWFALLFFELELSALPVDLDLGLPVPGELTLLPALGGLAWPSSAHCCSDDGPVVGPGDGEPRRTGE